MYAQRKSLNGASEGQSLFVDDLQYVPLAKSKTVNDTAGI